MNKGGPIIIIEDDLEDQELLTEVFTKTQVMNVSIIEAKSYCNNELVANCEMKIFLQEN